MDSYGLAVFLMDCTVFSWTAQFSYELHGFHMGCFAFLWIARFSFLLTDFRMDGVVFFCTFSVCCKDLQVVFLISMVSCGLPFLHGNVRFPTELHVFLQMAMFSHGPPTLFIDCLILAA